MKYLTIRCPRWKNLKNEDEHGVGINVRRYRDDNIIVRISYKKANGDKMYPHFYGMTRDKLNTYPIERASGRKPDLFIVPIKDFMVKEDPKYKPKLPKMAPEEMKPKQLTLPI